VLEETVSAYAFPKPLVCSLSHILAASIVQTQGLSRRSITGPTLTSHRYKEHRPDQGRFHLPANTTFACESDNQLPS
jgi:hypothetical protein